MELNDMEKVKNIKELEKRFDAINSSTAGDTRFIAEGMYFLCNKLDDYFSFEKRLKLLLKDIETRFGEEMNPKELFIKRFPEVDLNYYDK